MSFMAPDLVGKQLEVLQEVVPTVSRVALLRQPTNPASAVYLREAEAAARILGVRLQTVDARNPQEIDSSFAAMTRERAGARLICPDALFGTHRRRIAELAAKRRLLTIHAGTLDYADDGGFIVYSPNTLDLELRAVTYVDKILKGAKPADLPVEQPTKFERIINRKTAKALGLTIPQTLLQRADRIIQ